MKIFPVLTVFIALSVSSAGAKPPVLDAVPQAQWGQDRHDPDRHIWVHPKGDIGLSTPDDWTWTFVTPRTHELTLLQVFSPRTGGPARACTLMREALTEGQGVYNSFAAAQTALPSLLDDYADEIRLNVRDIFPEANAKIEITKKGLVPMISAPISGPQVKFVSVDMSIEVGAEAYLMRSVGLDLPDKTFVTLSCLVGPDDAAWLDTLPAMLRVHSAVLTPADR
ncbi:hypothetical protein [Asticcacaulis sp. YBE204]|uniref:hypothetical protein n=1 Tax=Asticcacaulis sp. YBE204 TaxID=1282363 RepID=UPI0003C3C4A3|nr:hypothetical protein [Asticcacaulis sp. YBE204]ESQ78291.1 hypothetical protein AEYBE204_14060 [Asticcacaulis sp. YBE204]